MEITKKWNVIENYPPEGVGAGKKSVIQQTKKELVRVQDPVKELNCPLGYGQVGREKLGLGID